jgi:hypothetical protein
MKRKNLIIFGIIILVILIGILLIRTFSSGGEDNWIKDERGVYIKHGNPSSTPDYVSEQQVAISKALELYEQNKSLGMNFSSQCLGNVEDYSIDIASVPKTNEDNLAINQCEDYANGKVTHFIELDKEGTVVRVM